MQGLVLAPGSAPELRGDLPHPAGRPGWTRVRVLCMGVCATDLALSRGYLDFRGVPGHEFVGEAREGPHQGRRVVGEINATCGQCAACRAGNERHCPRRTVLGILGLPGACAEELILPERNLLPVPDGVTTDAAVFTEPLAAALHIADDVDLRTHRRALLAGDGKLGLLCAWALHLHGCEVTVAGRHAERAPLLPQGSRHVVGWLEAGSAVAGESFDLAVDATGDPAVLPRLLPFVRPRGTIMLKTTSERPGAMDLSLAVVNEVRIMGSRCGPFAPALAALARHAVPVERLIEARFPLARAADAFAHAGRPGGLKTLVDVGDAS